MRQYVPVMLVLLTGCGASPTIQPSAAQVIQTNGNVTYTLTSTANKSGPIPATLNVDRAVSVTMPKTITALSNAAYMGRADLTIGATFCAYASDGLGVYVRQDGSCNTFSPDSSITLQPSDSVSLTLEGCPSSPVSVQAEIMGAQL